MSWQDFWYTALLDLPAFLTNVFALVWGIRAWQESSWPLQGLTLYLGLNALVTILMEVWHRLHSNGNALWVYLLLPYQVAITLLVFAYASETRRAYLALALAALGLGALGLVTFHGNYDSPFLHLEHFLLLAASMVVIHAQWTRRDLPLSVNPIFWIAAAAFLEMSFTLVPMLASNWLGARWRMVLLALFLIKSLGCAGSNLLYARAYRCLRTPEPSPLS